MTNLNVFVAYRGDGLSDKAREATLADKADDLSKLNQRIHQANGILQTWAESHGGRMVAVMGDGGRLEIGADHLHELPQLREQYEKETKCPLSVGIGRKLSEAEQALEFAVKSGGNSVELWTEELVQELAVLTDPDDESNLFESYLDKAEPALNTPAAGGGMTGPSNSAPTAPMEPVAEGSEHSENESLQNMLANQPPADTLGQFNQLAEQSEGQEQQQKQQQVQGQQQEEQGDNLRGAIVDVLKQFKEQGPLWEQLKQAQPDAYKTLTGVIQAMIGLAKQAYSGEGQEGQEDKVKKSEDDLFDKSTVPMVPPMHTTVEGFMGQLKTMPKVGPERGKFITSHMNHAPFLSALQAHPQGPQIHGMLTQFMNSKANAGVGVGAKVMAKNEGAPFTIASKGVGDFHIHSIGPKAGLPADAPSATTYAVKANPALLEPKFLKYLFQHAHMSNKFAPFVRGTTVQHLTTKDAHKVMMDHMNSLYGASVKKKDLMPGGKGDDKPDSKFKDKSLRSGIRTEMSEHGLDTKRAKEIAKDHLTEDSSYYKAGPSMHHALKAGKTGRHQVVLPVGSQIDAAPSAGRAVGRLKVSDPATGKTKWRSVRSGMVMAPDGSPTSSRNPSGGAGK